MRELSEQRAPAVELLPQGFQVDDSFTEADVKKILRNKGWYLIVKRCFDIFNSLWQIIFFSPFLLLSAIAIKLYDRGPVFFTQERITGGIKGPRTFNIIKLRTMVLNAEKLGMKITGKADPRITPVGRILRNVKLDEVPQLFNILRGEMSFVGPRPQTLGYVARFKEHYELIHSVVPAGLTDLASINFRHEEELLDAADDPERIYNEELMPLKIRYHQDYVRRLSFGLDVMILSKTLIQVFIKR